MQTLALRYRAIQVHTIILANTDETYQHGGAMISRPGEARNENKMQRQVAPSARCRSQARCAALMLMCASFGANAQGWFAGGSVGSAKQDDYSIGGIVDRRDDTDTAFRIIGGYLVTPNQGVIASAVGLGTALYAGPSFGGFRDKLDANGIDISYIVGFTPGNQQRFGVFGTVGLFDWDQDVRLFDSSGLFKFRDEGTSFSMGFGADINLSADGTNRWSIQAAYQFFKDVGDADNSGFELDREMLSLGIGYRFGGAVER